MREQILEFHELVFGSFDKMVNTVNFDSINHQALVADVRTRLAEYGGRLPPFDVVVGAIKEALAAAQDITNDDIASLPPDLQRLVEITRESLGAARQAYEDKIVSIYEKHFSPDDLTVLVPFFKSNTNQQLRDGGLLNPALTNEDIDTLAVFLKSEPGQKYRTLHIALQNELTIATSHWRNEALDSRREEIAKLLGFAEPEAAPVPTEVEPPPTAA